jgi:oligopeptide transport system substrate-binding protein
MKKLLSLLVAFTLLFSLVACSTSDTADTPDPEPRPTKKVLNWNIGADPKTLDPGLNGASDGGDVINQTFEGLVREKQGELYPGMATSWEVSEDGLTVTFQMRDGAKWSDGSALDATDFVYSWKRAMNPNTASEYSWIWHYTNIVGAEEVAEAAQGEEESDEDFQARIETLLTEVGVTAKEDGKVLEVQLKQPTGWIVSLLSFYHFIPVPEAIVSDPDKAGQDGFWAKTPEYAISNGPFKLKGYNVSAGLTLEKNEHYWNAENVMLDEINGWFIEEASTAYAKYLAGELDFIPSVPTAEVPKLIAESDEFHVFPLLGTYYINFNLADDVEGHSDPIWQNQKLRLALSYSINRDEITETLGAGQVSAAGFVPPGFLDHNGDDFFETAGTYGFVSDDGKFEDAKVLFAEAAAELGLTEEALIAKLEEKTYLYNTSEGHKTVAELVQEMWKTNLGFTIQLANEEWAVFQVTRTAGNFDLARGGWLTDFMDPSGMLGIMTDPTYPYNDAAYDSAAFQEQMKIASEATEAAAHFEALYNAQEIFMTDSPVIPIYHYSDTMLASDKISGWSRSVLGSVDFSGASLNE